MHTTSGLLFSDSPDTSFAYRIDLSFLPFPFLCLPLLIQKTNKTRSVDPFNPQMNRLSVFPQSLRYPGFWHPLFIELPTEYN